MPTNQSSAAENIWTRKPARGVILSHQGRVAFVVVMGSLSASSTPNKWQCHPTNFTMPNRIAASATTPPAKPNSRTRADSRCSLQLGGPGLALAVIYAEFQYLLPTDGVVLGLGRHYAEPHSRGLRAPGLRELLRSWLVNPPVIAGVAAVTLRLLGVDISEVVAPVGPAIGLLFGLIGFPCRSASRSRSSPSPTTAATCGGPRSPSPCG